MPEHRPNLDDLTKPHDTSPKGCIYCGEPTTFITPGSSHYECWKKANMP